MGTRLPAHLSRPRSLIWPHPFLPRTRSQLRPHPSPKARTPTPPQALGPLPRPSNFLDGSAPVRPLLLPPESPGPPWPRLPREPLPLSRVGSSAVRGRCTDGGWPGGWPGHSSLLCSRQCQATPGRHWRCGLSSSQAEMAPMRPGHGSSRNTFLVQAVRDWSLRESTTRGFFSHRSHRSRSL